MGARADQTPGRSNGSYLLVEWLSGRDISVGDAATTSIAALLAFTLLMFPHDWWEGDPTSWHIQAANVPPGLSCWSMIGSVCAQL